MSHSFSMTSVNLTKDVEVGNPEEDQIRKDEVSFRYYALQRLRKDSVTKSRQAASAMAAAKIAAAEYEKASIDFLTEAGKINPLVEVEQVWTSPYQNDSGDVILDSPQTEKDMRMVLRLNHKHISKAVEESGLNESDMSDMFGAE